jgi:perosamine synthetase
MIPLSVPNINGNEWKYVKECLDTGWISSVGSYVTEFEKRFAEYVGAPYAVACMNGTVGLHIAMQICGVKRNDYVIVPNITFIASANSIAYTGADPIFIDVEANTWQMDAKLLRKFFAEQTEAGEKGRVLKADGRRISAIMPVHVLGNMCDMDAIMSIADEYGVDVVEDATEALGSKFKGIHSGLFGKMSCFSFNGNKIISTGGGGMIITDDEALAKKAKHLTTQAKADPMEYFHDEVGYNYRLVNVLAAIGVAQMEQFPEFLERKKQINAFYRSQLEGVGDISFQETQHDTEPNCWLFTLSTDRKQALLDHLNGNGIQSRPFWVPMVQLPMYTSHLYITENDNSRRIYNRSVSIPCSTNITEEELQTVVDAIKSFYDADV